MLSEKESLLAEHLGLTEEEARKGQQEGRYVHLADYLIMGCLQKDRAEFQDLSERINRKFGLIKDIQTAWSFLEKFRQAVEELEK